jgi:hypothetical protein
MNVHFGFRFRKREIEHLLALTDSFTWEELSIKNPEKGYFQDRDVDGTVGLERRETGWEGVEWIHLAQDSDRWRALVNAVMNLRVLAPRKIKDSELRDG